MLVSTVDLTGNTVIDVLLAGTRWGNASSSATSVSYSFPFMENSKPQWDLPYSRSNEYQLAFGFDPEQQATATSVLDLWASVANLDLTRVDESSGDTGIIRMAFTNIETIAEWWGWAYFPGKKATSGGDVWINAAYDDKDWSAGSENFMLLLHETGHALGLKHPFSGEVQLPDDEDSTMYTVMSYTDPADNVLRRVSGNVVTYEVVYPSGPMLYDIAAIQYLYGANTDYNADDSAYLFDPEIPFYRTIWDGGGTDSLSVETFMLGCRLDLRAGQFSDVRFASDALPDGMFDSQTANYEGKNNLAIAYGVMIENAYGGHGDDVINGNEDGNLLAGNAGNDTLIGGAGSDTLIGGMGDDLYVVTDLMDQVVELSASGGCDLVSYSPSAAGTCYTLGVNLENLVVDCKLSVAASGNALDNMIYAGAGDNSLDGGDGLDTLSYANSARGVRVSLDGGTDMTGEPQVQKTRGSGNDSVLNFESLTGSMYADRLTGNSGDNVLYGLAGNDLLSGGDGEDELRGGSGKDSLEGGNGTDRFVFDTPLHGRRNVDVILDFDPDNDYVVLDPEVFGALRVSSDDVSLSGERLLIGDIAAASDEGAYLAYDPRSGSLYFNAGFDGSSVNTPFARLLSATSGITADSFVWLV